MVYPEAMKAEALRLYAEVGPSEAARRTGIPKTTISGWARKSGLRTDASAKTRAATEAAAARNGERREAIRAKFLERIDRALDRMVERYVEYVGKDGNYVEYPEPPGGAMRDLAITAATLLDKYRLEMGETTARSEVNIRGRIEEIARAMGLDPDEVMAEAESILRSVK